MQAFINAYMQSFLSSNQSNPNAPLQNNLSNTHKTFNIASSYSLLHPNLLFLRDRAAHVVQLLLQFDQLLVRYVPDLLVVFAVLDNAQRNALGQRRLARAHQDRVQRHRHIGQLNGAIVGGQLVLGLDDGALGLQSMDLHVLRRCRPSGGGGGGVGGDGLS